jgi:hypothetical protein
MPAGELGAPAALPAELALLGPEGWSISEALVAR